MTRGVSKIGYIGQASRADVMKLMMPITLTDPAPWHVVVRGEKTAYSAGGKRPSFGPEIKDTPDTYAEHPVMAAWRNVGRGRLFLFPHNACQTITSPDVFDHFLWDPRDREREDRPENRTFIMQTIAWAAEPSFDAGLGGFRTDRDLRPDEEAILKPTPLAPIDWRRVPTGDDLAPRMGMLKGLIGAQSRFSGKQHSVARLCEVAREAGLSFLAFTENLEDLTPETWQELQRECDAASDDTFLALPGMLALDKPGNTHFAFGKATFPTPTSVTPDGKRLDNLAQFWFRTYGTRMTGFANVGTNPNPWHEIRKTSGFAIQTHEGTRLTDESLDVYLRSSYNMENYLPFCFTRLSAPDEIAAAAQGMVNVFTGGSVAALDDYVHGRGVYQRNLFWEKPHHWYLSTGPRIEYNGGFNIGNLAVDEESENLVRYGFRLTGLRKGDRILLMDGPRLFRQWLAAGPSFRTEHTWPHEQARVFIVHVVRDGETVLVGSPVTLNYGRRFNSCGDRQNSLPYNYQPDENGNWYVTGIPLHAKYKSWQPNTLVYATCKSWLIGAVGVEEHPTLMTGWFTSPNIPFDSPRVEGGFSLSSYHDHRLSCPGVVIADEICQRVWHDLSPGDYVGCYPQGLVLGGAHYLVSGDITSRFHLKPTGFSSVFMLDTASRWRKGQTFEYTILYTNGGSVPHRPSSDYEKAAAFLGLRGSFPAIEDVSGGTLLPSPVIATIETTPEDVVRLSTVRNPKDPIGLTIRMAGFEPNWQAVYRLDGSTKWRYFGQLDGYFYFNLYTKLTEHTVMAGHPLLADRDDIRIMLDDPTGSQSAFEVYNPLAEPVTVNLRSNPAFFGPWSSRVDLAPYESKRVRVSSRPIE